MMGFKSMRQILLARHGETDWNARRWVQGSTDTSLNESGVRQAERLSEKLLARGGRIERVFTSEMRRARETAEIVAGRLNIPLIARAGLQELNLGDWEGRTWRQIERGWPERFAEWSRDKRSVRPPHGETYQELLERFVGAVRRIVSGGAESHAAGNHAARLRRAQRRSHPCFRGQNPGKMGRISRKMNGGMKDEPQ